MNLLSPSGTDRLLHPTDLEWIVYVSVFPILSIYFPLSLYYGDFPELNEMLPLEPSRQPPASRPTAFSWCSFSTPADPTLFPKPSPDCGTTVGIPTLCVCFLG